MNTLILNKSTQQFIFKFFKKRIKFSFTSVTMKEKMVQSHTDRVNMLRCQIIGATF